MHSCGGLEPSLREETETGNEVYLSFSWRDEIRINHRKCLKNQPTCGRGCKEKGGKLSGRGCG